jgi:carbon monoxide dehydrogenase subunit G
MPSKPLTFNEQASGRLLTAAAAVFLLMQASYALAEQPPANLTVREERGVYTVVARFLVDQPASVALSVLTDYEQIPTFIPGVRSSIVRERTIGRAVVEQEAVSSVMMFSKRIHLVLEIEEQPNALVFSDRCGRSFARYKGAWRVSQRGGHTAITYELTAQPSFDVPGFMLKRLLRRDSAQMIERLQREIAVRATSGAGLGLASPQVSSAPFSSVRWSRNGVGSSGSDGNL